MLTICSHDPILFQIREEGLMGILLLVSLSGQSVNLRCKACKDAQNGAVYLFAYLIQISHMFSRINDKWKIKHSSKVAHCLDFKADEHNESIHIQVRMDVFLLNVIPIICRPTQLSVHATLTRKPALTFTMEMPSVFPCHFSFSIYDQKRYMAKSFLTVYVEWFA